MSNLDLPPLPAPGTSGPQVCALVRSYLAIIDELPAEQVRVLSAHIQECSPCTEEFQRLQKATRLLASLPASTPSTGVDEAILTFLRERSPEGTVSTPKSHRRTSSHSTRVPFARRRRGPLALVAALILVLVLTLTGVLVRGLIWPAGGTQAFQLPAQLSWNGYVLHYTQNKSDVQGKAYQIEVYQDLGTQNMHIESTMPGKFDVVIVIADASMLGKDMMHHVAQVGDGVANWTVDGSLFDLARLRQDLTAGRAVYLGTGTFQGQEVYQVRAGDGRVLLLNSRYLPVNVLRAPLEARTGVPFYQVFTLLPSNQVADSMWNMQVPPDFQMGKLPEQS